MGFWVYMLRCHDGSYYTGHTDALEQRIAEHTSGAFTGCYTYQRRPVELVFAQEVATREEALAAERRIKGWSRAKKEAMIRGDWDEVSRLGRSSFDPSAGSGLRTNGDG
jgi:predicted GIY-YIG superfamily endonuclease